MDLLLESHDCSCYVSYLLAPAARYAQIYVHTMSLIYAHTTPHTLDLTSA
jgi:hypothetical protein